MPGHLYALAVRFRPIPSGSASIRARKLLGYILGDPATHLDGLAPVEVEDLLRENPPGTQGVTLEDAVDWALVPTLQHGFGDSSYGSGHIVRQPATLGNEMTTRVVAGERRTEDVEKDLVSGFLPELERLAPARTLCGVPGVAAAHLRVYVRFRAHDQREERLCPSTDGASENPQLRIR